MFGVLSNGIQFEFARLKLVLLKSHIRREFIDIIFLGLGQAIKSLGESCLRHSKFVEQDEQDHVWIWFGLC